uniref:Hydroxysteroid dehydrogenase-like protein 2 n=1 Tax=Macrostomum lignano TaxID=282301 RepID=A0A1I8FDW2_9PLAT
SWPGKTLFITGASRGNWARNRLCAQPATLWPPRLPPLIPSCLATIYTAAEEIEKAGGKALPCNGGPGAEGGERSRGSVRRIDILVNNASAINLVNTETLTMKSFDLMHGINSRGTFLCSKLCIPYLSKSANPHILNISRHCPCGSAGSRTTMCVLGMSPELAKYGIAVNALWPRTAILTAAMKMLAGGDEVTLLWPPSAASRRLWLTPPYLVLTKDSRTFSGQFCIDDDVLRREGGLTDKDLEQYSCAASCCLIFFLDEPDAAKPAATSASSGAQSGQQQPGADVEASMKHLATAIDAEAVGLVKGLVELQLTDLNRSWLLNLKSMPGGLSEIRPGDSGSTEKPDTCMTMKSADLQQLVSGKLSATGAFMAGKLRITGNMGVAMKLEKVFSQSCGCLICQALSSANLAG